MADNDLLEQMRRARETQEKIERDRTKVKSESRIERMSEDLNMFHRFILQVIAACQWSFWNVGVPTWKVVRWPFWKLLKQYRRLWSLVVYRRDEFENLRFSKVRAGAFLTSTVIFVWFFLWPLTFFVGETVSYGLTAKVNETIYLHNSQEIDSENNIHSVQGATRLPLDENDTIYFRIEGTLFNHLWSLVHGHGLFYSDYVSATVPPGLNICTTTSYGFRLKLLMRNWEIYPHLLSATCSPVNGEDLK
jgi:hypothetical protein